MFWLLSAPRPLDASVLPQHTADISNGERLYNAGGCHSCHKPSPEMKDVDAGLPAGGYPLKTPIGTLYPPNLTPDPETGLGRWTDIQFVNAVQRGISPGGRHYIPAFPYTSYAAMGVEDVLDIKAYLATLPPVKSPERDDGLPLAFLRRGIGLWKLVGLDTAPWQPDPAQSQSWNRGSYLVNGPGHCAECHTPRNFFMVRDDARAFAGGSHPDGSGDKVPSQRDLIGRGRYKDVKDLATALQFGEIFGYDKLSRGGMGQVQVNIAKLPETDITAIAEYLASLK